MARTLQRSQTVAARHLKDSQSQPSLREPRKHLQLPAELSAASETLAIRAFGTCKCRTLKCERKEESLRAALSSGHRIERSLAFADSPKQKARGCCLQSLVGCDPLPCLPMALSSTSASIAKVFAHDAETIEKVNGLQSCVASYFSNETFHVLHGPAPLQRAQCRWAARDSFAIAA